jgi:hypothetical protein
MTSSRNKFLFSGRSVAKVTFTVIVLIIVIVWLLGFRTHRDLWENALISASVISATLFVFLTLGLYKGIALHDDFTQPVSLRKERKKSGKGGWLEYADIPEVDGEGCLVALALWIGIALLYYLFSFLLPAGIEMGMLGFSGLLYWVFYRALHTVFTRSPQCEGSWVKSITQAAFFTILYCGWIFGVIYLVEG